MVLFALFVLIPIIEISLFVTVGGAIGLWPTLFIVFGSALLGSVLMRSQGQQAMKRLQASFDQQQDPSEPLADGAMILIAGMLLIAPGFFTDTLGLLLLLPPVRHKVFTYLRSRVNVQGAQFSMRSGFGPGFGASRGDVIDGDFEEVTPRPRTGPSKWVDVDDAQPRGNGSDPRDTH